jgi:hypothetical protein
MLLMMVSACGGWVRYVVLVIGSRLAGKKRMMAVAR